MPRRFPGYLTGFFFLTTMAVGQPRQDTVRLVLLGTGTPNANPDRFGPSVAVTVNDHAYLFDCGAGIIRRAVAASRKGVTALRVQNLHTLFITHLHSDH